MLNRNNRFARPVVESRHSKHGSFTRQNGLKNGLKNGLNNRNNRNNNNNYNRHSNYHLKISNPRKQSQFLNRALNSQIKSQIDVSKTEESIAKKRRQNEFLNRAVKLSNTANARESEKKKEEKIEIVDPIMMKEIESEYSDLRLHRAIYQGYDVKDGLSKNGFKSYVIEQKDKDSNEKSKDDKKKEEKRLQYIDFDKRKERYLKLESIANGYKCELIGKISNMTAKKLINQLHLLSGTKRQLAIAIDRTKEFINEMDKIELSEQYWYLFRICSELWENSERNKSRENRENKLSYVYSLYAIEALNLFDEKGVSYNCAAKDFRFIFENMILFKYEVYWTMNFIDERCKLPQGYSIGNLSQYHTTERCMVLKYQREMDKEKYEKHEEKDSIKMVDYICTANTIDKFYVFDASSFYDKSMSLMVLFFLILSNNINNDIDSNNGEWNIDFAFTWAENLLNNVESYAIPEKLELFFDFLLYCGESMKKYDLKRFVKLIESMYLIIFQERDVDANECWALGNDKEYDFEKWESGRRDCSWTNFLAVLEYHIFKKESLKHYQLSYQLK